MARLSLCSFLGCLVAGFATALLLAGSAMAQEPDGEVPVESPEVVEEPAPVVVVSDPVAGFFMNRCAGCHTVGGGIRTGPDLVPATGWRREDLWTAVKRMEAHAGPMTNDQIDEMVEFLKDGGVRERIADEDARRASMVAATLEPASVAKGRALYYGERTFRSGAPNCASCHVAGGRGGNLGPDLTTVFARYGNVALMSAIEQSTFPVMKPIYEAHPVSRQEAAHLAAFLEAVANDELRERGDLPVVAIAFAGGGGMLALLTVVGIRRRPGTRARLVREANRR